MSNKRKLSIVFFVVLVVSLSVYVWQIIKMHTSTEKKQGNQLSVYSNWQESYGISSLQPYGLSQWNALLSLHIDSTQTILSLEDAQQLSHISDTIKATFIFVGERFTLFPSETKILFEQVKKGATCLIAYENMEANVLRFLFDKLEIGFYYDTATTIGIDNKLFEFTARYETLPIAKKWNGYKTILPQQKIIKPHELKSLSEIGTLSNGLKISYGKGTILLNTTPEVFKNYQLITPHGYQHARYWMDEIPTNAPIYWLEFARHDPTKATSTDDINSSKMNYLHFILEEKRRLSAFLLALLGIVLFLLFRAKRMQPIIPLMPTRRNNTTLFANTISSIYFNQRQPEVLLKLQKNNFIHMVQKYFHVDLSKEISQKKLDSLAQKSKTNQREILRILSALDGTSQQTISEQELIAIRLKILDFYRRSGIISPHFGEQPTKKHNRTPLIICFLLFIASFAYGILLMMQAQSTGVIFWFIGCVPLGIGIYNILKK